MPNEEVTALFNERQKQMVEGIDILDGLKIRRISKEDVEDLRSNFLMFPANVRLHSNTFIVEKRLTLKDSPDLQIAKTMQNVVLALRLLKRGYVSGSHVFYILVSKRQLESWYWSEERQREIFGDRYYLNFAEIPDLRKIVEKLESIDFVERKSLSLACKRFQRTYEEATFEDQLIDLMIAFEALFVRKEVVGSSQKQKIANGCAVLLGKSDEERNEIRSFLFKARQIRDLVVHGAEYKIEDIMDKYDFDFIPRLESYLRESIKKSLG